MRALIELDARAVVGLFTDIDDTLTTNGRMPAAAYDALTRLADAGLRVVPVTGRSAGWAHMAMHLWPVHAVIAESGGVCLHRDQAQRLCWMHHAAQAAVRDDRQRIASLAETVMREVPGLALASDNAFRIVDFALDYCEQVERVPHEQVERAVRMFREAGFQARASTVHINVWSGDFDKAPMALRYLREAGGGGEALDPDRWVFVGDAPNDVSMFETFAKSVGVANILRFRGQLATPPAFVTRASYADGFIELAQHLLAQRLGA
ncbi:MAG: HAD-IIB family hydrolase [Burkholderiaceae bacterium]|nr:HAD-IIB family hydrolase [Burkholderiaceae bacterium]